LGPTTLYGHAERGRSNRKGCLLFNRRRVHKGENYIRPGWEVPNAENSACLLRSRRKSTAHHYKISSDDQGNPEWLLGGMPDIPPDEAPTLASQGIAQDGWLVSVSLEGRSPSHLFLIKKLSIFFPFFSASTIHFGFTPRPAQVSPDGLRYFGGTFLPFIDLPDLPLGPGMAANCFSISVRHSRSRLST
jgi:hypothetical protein